MLHAAVRAENLQAHFKAKGAAQPVNGSRRIVIKERDGYAWPASRRIFHEQDSSRVACAIMPYCKCAQSALVSARVARRGKSAHRRSRRMPTCAVSAPRAAHALVEAATMWR